MITGRHSSAHSPVVMLATHPSDEDAADAVLASPSADDTHNDAPTTERAASFNAVYEEHFAFVWRTARRLGVPDASLDDAVQDVFVVVHARLGDFEARSSIRTWLFGITRRVVRAHRPRKDRVLVPEATLTELAAPSDRGPQAQLEKAEGNKLLHALLDTLDDEKREAFVLAELEELSMPDVADALGINVNTAASRVRAARKELDLALARMRAKQRWRLPWAR